MTKKTEPFKLNVILLERKDFIILHTILFMFKLRSQLLPKNHQFSTINHRHPTRHSTILYPKIYVKKNRLAISISAMKILMFLKYSILYVSNIYLTLKTKLLSFKNSSYNSYYSTICSFILIFTILYYYIYLIFFHY